MKTNAKPESFKAIGVMSGTSLDGMDLVAVEFTHLSEKWSFELQHSQTLAYPEQWEEKLRNAHQLRAEELMQLHSAYGTYTGEKVLAFMQSSNVQPDFVASHGHTIFHQPENGYTLQIGHGANIAAQTKTTVISDFRSGDVALGGQGAPLVPIGDKLLFGNYKYCLNIGGFSNISFDENNLRLAYDIGPANFVLNHYAQQLGKPYDKNGDFGRQGQLDANLLRTLNALPYFKETPPKSLGREWVESDFLPLIEETNLSTLDKLRILYEHIAQQIAANLSGKDELLITGGGALNQFLVERIKSHTTTQIHLPEKEIIDFKEAIIFAFLGVLRMKHQSNCLASVTGASRDNCSGVIHTI